MSGRLPWACPEDRTELATRDGALACPCCGKTYPAMDGVPVFSPGSRSRTLDELWGLMRDRTADDAAREFCASHGCAPAPFCLSWMSFFSVRPGMRVLELGAGFGDDTCELAAAGARVVALVPGTTHARIVARTLHDRSVRGCEVAVLDRLERLPLADGAVQAIALEEDARGGFGLEVSALPAAAAEWRRVLAPDGFVFLSLRNGLYDWPGVRHGLRALGSRAPILSLDRRIKRETGGGALRAVSPRTVVRVMTRAGFGRPLIHAPLPDENDAQVVVPVEDARAVRYFLEHLVGRNSVLVQAALRAASVLSTVGLFGRVVPHYYLMFRPAGAPGGPGR